MVEIIGAILALAIIILKKVLSKEQAEKRKNKRKEKEQHGRDKALAKGDSEVVSSKLSDLFHGVREKNSRNSRQ